MGRGVRVSATVEAVTRIRASASVANDALGVPIPGADVETALSTALFAPGGSDEPVQVGRTPVVSSPGLYWRGEWPDVVATDRVRVRGRVFAVDGDPADWPPHGISPGGLVVKLKAVEG